MEDEVLILLYCNTHDNGEGCHYEWIRPESAEAELGDHDAIPDLDISDSESGDSLAEEYWTFLEDRFETPEEVMLDVDLHKSEGDVANKSAAQDREKVLKDPVDDDNEDLLEDESPTTMDLITWMCTPRPLGPQPFLTEWDQENQAASRLAMDMRDQPTLPPDLQDQDRPCTDVASGLKFPPAHCAFRGCMWASDSRDDVKPHVCSHHGARIIEVCGPIAEDSLFDFYCAAISTKERANVPRVGFSIDRRSIDQTVEVYNDASIKQLVCLVCAQSKTCVPHVNSLIEYKPAAWLHNLSAKSLRLNLDFSHFQARYATSGPLAGVPGLKDWEWRPQLQLPGREPTMILCCPEDVFCKSDHDVHILCQHCQIPLCRDCRITMTAKDSICAVPMALANDNWYDYVPEIIHKWKVRFI